jgi:hypothetical protein
MDNGSKAQLTNHQCQVTYQSDHLKIVLVPGAYPPMKTGKQEQYRVKQDEVTDNDTLLDETICLIIIPHITPPIFLS